MKNKIIKTTIAGGLLLAMFTTTLVSGSDAGTTSDPLVTKSYVDAKILDLKSLVTETIAAMDLTSGTSSSDSQYKVVYLTNGSTIYGGEGTEMILRSGKAVIVSSTANGLVNMTTGVDALSGTEVSLNNLMIVPRQDGRGLEITSGDANVMVRGYYEITQ